MSAAIALCPRPRLSTTPAAIATTFLSAPPISTPATSSVAYSRSDGPRNSCWTRRAASADGDATTTAVGSPAATSAANVGPDSTATGRVGPASSAITCDIGKSVPCSRPLAALTNGTADRGDRDGAMHHGAQALRRHRDDHQRGGADGVLHRGRGTDAVDERDAGQIVGVLARLDEAGDERGVPAPQAHVVSEAPQVHGQRGAPAACPENGDGVHEIRWPASARCRRAAA